MSEAMAGTLRKANTRLARQTLALSRALEDIKGALEGDTEWTADRWCDAAESAMVIANEALDEWGFA